MGLHLYTSNRIEELSAIFCEKIKHKDTWHQVSNIVVQTKGLEKWLAMQAASRNKIFANYEFSNPDGFIAKIQQLAGNYGNSYFSRENIKWKTYTYLSEDDFVQHFPNIASYFEDDDIKRIQLAGKVADLFEQYQIYRPHIIEAWNTGKKAENDDDEHFTQQEEWQYFLWKKLKTESNGRFDQVQRKQHLLEKMNSLDFQNSAKKMFPHIHIFGIAVLSDYYWETYQKLATIIDISIYTTTPSSADKWYIESTSEQSNELLGSCKELSANLYQLLNLEEADKRYLEPQGTKLLECVQSDILYNHNEGIKQYDTTQQDGSLHIVSSYTPVREVEALYNHLLNEFEKNPKLKGHEVSVQLTDVELYAPLVKAVFDNAPKKIPYFISDENYSTGDSLIKAVDLFFNLPYANFKAENVLQLFDYSAIRERFDVQDVDMIRQIVADANIRYGIEGNKDDETYLFSWRHGLSKLILGYAIKGGACYTMNEQDYFPCDAIEGSDALNIFKIKAFADTLFDLHEQSKRMLSIAEWKDYLLNEVFDALFSLNDSYNDEVDYIYKKLENLSAATIEVDDKISFEVFREGLINLLRSETTNNNYTSGLLTFSSIIPVRSMPFKHIAILGLNAGVFPRQQKHLGFDLMAIKPLANDRNLKNNDKYLFLEALLSAREQLYLSYIGSSIKDNSELPPSLLIEELEDYLSSGTANKDWLNAKIKYKHPLHSSSKLYFEEGKFFTYLGERKEEELADLEENPEKEDNTINFDEINLKDLIDFYKDPFKWYYNKALRIYYRDDAILLADEEPFALDHLQKWGLKNTLVPLNDKEEELYIKRSKNDGRIQLANVAKAEISIEKEEVEAIKKEYNKLAQGELINKNINIKFDDCVLKGSLNNISEQGQICYNVSKEGSQAKYLLELFIKHLAYRSTKDNAQSQFISSTYRFALNEDFIDSFEAKNILKQLIGHYKDGHQQIIPFSPNAALELQKALNDGKPKEEALKKAIKKIKSEGEENNYSPVPPNDYIRKEIEAGYFDLLLAEVELSDTDEEEVAFKQEQLLHLSELFFRKLSTLLSTL